RPRTTRTHRHRHASAPPAPPAPARGRRTAPRAPWKTEGRSMSRVAPTGRADERVVPPVSA
ncbi:hypothetical protein, partial [Streptomyces sp. SID10692]|uniref:hypothetical protein n=1 Tax=Streptomyces sp. SID10692 TaxID=2706026 RepID=UPI0019428C21